MRRGRGRPRLRAGVPQQIAEPTDEEHDHGTAHGDDGGIDLEAAIELELSTDPDRESRRQGDGEDHGRDGASDRDRRRTQQGDRAELPGRVPQGPQGGLVVLVGSLLRPQQQGDRRRAGEGDPDPQQEQSVGLQFHRRTEPGLAVPEARWPEERRLPALAGTALHRRDEVLAGVRSAGQLDVVGRPEIEELVTVLLVEL